MVGRKGDGRLPLGRYRIQIYTIEPGSPVIISRMKSPGKYTPGPGCSKQG